MFDSLAQTVLCVTHGLSNSAEAAQLDKPGKKMDRRTRSLFKRLPMDTNSDLEVLLNQEGEADPSLRAA
ncbi:hypothetical protein [Algisphaera agarilytica]|uniref:Uncharacterized protein n=1 Tax=Algisphaera agarilytica TaxID=1385975 RepID=A0A7X0H7U3_9BACT|nr:hypothetical protein [Algisphaera agarilytica]MBB6429711.1 hypothetical protein [Algisphaera agarilytica]